MSKKKEEVTTIRKKISKAIEGLEWVHVKSPLNKTYYRVNPNDNLESITLDGFGSKLETTGVSKIMEMEGTLLKKGTYEKIKQDLGKFIKTKLDEN